MKKLFLATSILAASILTVQAQPLLTEHGIYEDFSTVNEYTADVTSGRGLFWWPSPNYTLVRNSVSKQLEVTASQKKWEHVPFGLGFGDDNGAAAGGVPYTVDLSGDGTWSFDITNTGTVQLAIYVQCVDINDVSVDCSPGATNFDNIWAYQTQIFVDAGTSVTFEAGSPNGAGSSVLNNCDFTTGVWGDYGTHTIRTDCNLKQIKGINITVLAGEKNPADYHAVELVGGSFTISNFSVGDTTVNAVTAPIPTIDLPISTLEIEGATDLSQKVGITTTGVWSAKSNANWLTPSVVTSTLGIDTIVFAATVNGSSSPRSTNVTLSSKYAEDQIITVTQKAAWGVGINDIDQRYFQIIGDTVYFDNTKCSIYSIQGKRISTTGTTHISLPSGIYIIQTPSGSQSIHIN
ncbi:MAG: BACON domain-containing protein [Bacteroidales bacterium]|jgi:hypothetical protein|nr:BACON domain-containing protein [Bacteroidales bacterium]